MDKPNPTKYMIATTAIHILGDISREEGSIAIIDREDDENYYGRWFRSFVGYYDICFPKSTTRELTELEQEQHNYHLIRELPSEKR